MNKKRNVEYLLKNDWRSQNFDFLSLNYLSLGQFLGSFNSRRYHRFFKILPATQKSDA